MMNEFLPRDMFPQPRGPEPTDPVDREILGFTFSAPPRHRAPRRSWGWLSMAVLATVALVALAVLSGCSEPTSSLSPTGAASAQEEPQEATGEPDPVAAEEEEPAEEPSPTPTQEVGAWGDTATYDAEAGEKLQVTLAAPTKVTAPAEGSSWSDFAEFDDSIDLENNIPVRFDVTMKNAGTTTIDPSMASITVLLGDDELENSCMGVGVECGTSLTKLRPGKSVKMAWSAWIPKARSGEEITVEFNPNWDYDSTVWVGTYSK